MTRLLPGFDEQLSRRATALASEHERRRSAGRGGRAVGLIRRTRRSHPLGLGVLIAAIAVSGGAYASQGLWRPAMGDERRGHPVASDSPLPPELLERYAVLRRAQTEEDRGAGSRDALRWQGGGKVIQTAGVRRVGTGDDGTALVVIPMEGRARAAGTPGRTGQLCLWRQDPKEAGGMGCASVDHVAAQGVEILMIDSPPSPRLSKRRSKEFQAWMRAHPGGGTLPERFAPRARPGTAHLAALVPDAVASARIGLGAEAVTVPVRGNLLQATRPEGSIFPIVWLGADGREIPRPQPGRGFQADPRGGPADWPRGG